MPTETRERAEGLLVALAGGDSEAKEHLEEIAEQAHGSGSVELDPLVILLVGRANGKELDPGELDALVEEMGRLSGEEIDEVQAVVWLKTKLPEEVKKASRSGRKARKAQRAQEQVEEAPQTEPKTEPQVQETPQTQEPQTEDRKIEEPGLAAVLKAQQLYQAAHQGKKTNGAKALRWALEELEKILADAMPELFDQESV